MLQVGSLYQPNRRKWPEAARLRLRASEQQLLLFIDSPGGMTQAGIRRLGVELAWVERPPVLMLLYSFAGIGWAGTPYNPHLVPQADRPGLSLRPELQVALVDASNGLVVGLRDLALPSAFMEALSAAVNRQAAQRWDPATFDRTEKELRRTPAADLLGEAVTRVEIRPR